MGTATTATAATGAIAAGAAAVGLELAFPASVADATRTGAGSRLYQESLRAIRSKPEHQLSLFDLHVIALGIISRDPDIAIAASAVQSLRRACSDDELVNKLNREIVERIAATAAPLL